MADRDPTTQARRSLLRAKIPDLLYGGVVAGSILAISSVHATESQHVALAVCGVAIVYWLAHVYVEAVGGRFEDREHATHHRLLTAMRENTEILIGQLPPVLVFLLCRLFGADISTSALVALVFITVMLTLTGALAGYLAGARGWPLIGETALAGAMGLVVIGLKFVLH